MTTTVPNTTLVAVPTARDPQDDAAAALATCPAWCVRHYDDTDFGTRVHYGPKKYVVTEGPDLADKALWLRVERTEALPGRTPEPGVDLGDLVCVATDTAGIIAELNPAQADYLAATVRRSVGETGGAR